TGAHLIARSVGLDPGGARLDQLDPTHLADLTRAAWAGWLRGRAPLAIVLDDMENADSALLALLSALAPLLGGARVTILLTARHGFAPPAGFRRLPLGPLLPEDVADLAADAIGRRVQPGLAQFLLERTGGSPFYAAQLARWLDDEGLLEGTPATLGRRPERLPEGLQALLVARLDALSSDARDAMKTASVFGRCFWRDLLAEIAGRDTGPDLAAATREEVVEERAVSALPGDAEFAFRQSLIQEAAYSLLTKRDRARLHGAAAAALESRAQSAGRRAKMLAAQQRELEGRLEEGARLWLEAANEAAAGKAWEEAAAASREARRLGAAGDAAWIELRAAAMAGVSADVSSLLAIIEASPSLTPARRSRALLDCAFVLQRTHGPVDYLVAAERAIEGVDDASRLEARYFHLSALVSASRLDDAAAAADSLIRDAEREPGASSYRAKALVQRGLIRQRRGFYDDAERDYDEAIVAIRAESTKTNLAGALRGRGLLLRNRGRFEDALRSIEESTSLLRESGDRVNLASSLTLRCTILRQLGRRDEAFASVREAVALSREMELRPVLANALTAEGNLHSESGDISGARRCWAEGLEIARTSGDRAVGATLLSNLASAVAEEGDHAGSRRMAEEALEIQRSVGGKRLVMRLLVQIAELDLHAGDFGAARARLEEALGIALDLGLRGEEGVALVRLAMAKKGLGDVAGARAALAEGVAFARGARNKLAGIPALTGAADLEIAAGNAAAAEILLEEAVRVAEAAGLPRRAEGPKLALARLRETKGGAR
ncbi:MAG: hypothetical protein FD180_4631, partial [Planctomycetota bacterium]